MWKKLFCLICGLSVSTSYASIVIMGTRVIYPAEKKSVVVQVTNDGNNPALIQSWIDDGNINATPDQIKVPFLITPPIARIEAKQGQSLRLSYTGGALPTDRESVFYLNILDVPPKHESTKQDESYLQIAIRQRLKLLFRPADLKMKVTDSYQAVTWKLSSQQGKTILTAQNPSPYYVTYRSVQLVQNGRTFDVAEPKMVAPFSSNQFVIPAKISASTASQVKWDIVNDYGGHSTGESTVQP